VATGSPSENAIKQREIEQSPILLKRNSAPGIRSAALHERA
jgi:hypothetical protein